MPALWQSSQRPMYVRTVWVDGFRHAILTHDDPHFLKLCARRRPHSSTSYVTKTTRITSSVRHNDGIDDLKKLQFVIRSNNVNETRQTRHTVSVEKLNLTSVESSADELEDNASQRARGIDTSETIHNWMNMKTTKSKTARHDDKESTELSDRVLQWLDLAGKIDLLAPNNPEVISQPRHSCPEIQRTRNLVKSKTSTELRSREIKQASDTKTSGSIDRPEFYLPTSANTIENYAKQSRTARSTQRHERKNDNKKVNNVRISVIETRKKIATERDAIEKQYADLMSKKFIPDVSKTRKQVHIFMPEAMTKKYGSSRTESLISQA